MRERNQLGFLAGGGEMGARMRALDWSTTPLGEPEHWPQSLKTIVRVMLDSRYAMWMLWGPEFTFFCNDAYLPTVGVKRDWVLGARSDKVWEEVWSDVEARILQVLEKGEATWDERLRLFLERRGFPEETYHTFSYSPVYDDAERIAGMLCVVTEVTARVLDERGLRVLRDMAVNVAGAQSVSETSRRLMDVLSNDPCDVPFAALYVLESNGRHVWRAAHCGQLPERLQPERIDVADECCPWPVTSVLSTGRPEQVDMSQWREVVPSPLWPERIQQAFILPVRNPVSAAGNAVLILGISTRRMFNEAYRQFFELVASQFAAALNQAHTFEAERQRAEKLAELDRAKTQFFSNVSHEFRTPLTLMQGPLTDLVHDPRTPSHVRERLALSYRNCLRLLKLVNSLLDFSRIEAGRMEAVFEPVELATLTRDIASTFRSAMEQASLEFIVECAACVTPAYVDQEMWEKIVLNLLSNAFKFTFEGKVTVRLHEKDGEAFLEVTDTGIGVPRHEIPRLFDRFHRVEGNHGRTYEGSGIGLALVYELVSLHSGTIEVQSEPGVGSTFRVAIPLGREHLAPGQVKAPRAPALAHTPAHTLAHAPAHAEEALHWVQAEGAQTSDSPDNRRFASTFGARIVLADDNADMRSYVAGLLGPSYSVECVHNGRQALEVAERERPDLIVSDIMMPQLDGFGLVRALRAHRTLNGIPIILLSARAGEESRVEGLDAGADDYLVKPFTARELLARVGAILERERHHARERHQLRTADRQKDEFLAMLAHELRNPLAPIRNAGELLARTMPNDQRSQAAVGIVKRQVTHLTRLVDDLLDVSRITQGRIELLRMPLQLSEVIAQALETVEPLLREKRHEVAVTQAFGTLRVFGDPARLVQCVANVLTNAAKYTDAGGNIRVESRCDGAEAVLTIRDNGPGIAPELMPRIFELFVQGQRTLDRSQGGLGIGLAVVRRLVEMHGGRVSVISNGAMPGSAFELRLPLIQHDAQESQAPEVAHSPIRRILVVDDNQDAADSLALLLTLDGHTVRSVQTPEKALECVQTFEPDIVLLDIGLPVIDGYEVARRIRAMADRPRMNLIALTGYGQPEDKRRADEAGFDEHLVKPVDLVTLQRTLSRLDRTHPRATVGS